MNLNLALDILAEMKAIEVCDICEYYTANKMSDSEVYKIATSKYKEKTKDKKQNFNVFHECVKKCIANLVLNQ